MYERFTDRARKVIQLANDEAQRFNHEYVGTEHILLGLVREGSGAAAHVLKNLNIDLARIRREVECITLRGPRDKVPIGKLPQTPRAKRIIEQAIDEAGILRHDYVGTEHLLLGLLGDQEGLAGLVLIHLGLKLESVRKEIPRLLESVHGLPARESDLPESNVIMEDPPEDLRRTLLQTDAQIEQFKRQKEVAVAEQQFEHAVRLRDQEHMLRKRKRRLLLEWPANYPIDPSWLSFNGGAVARIAQDIREETHWQELPVLADALEDAGCTNAEVLGHCRQPGEHWTRCWVVELLLGKV
jgi:ATP-dependent Clp protease ATP-binding subunit ClpA